MWSCRTQKTERPSWVQFEFAPPFRAQAFTIAAGTGSTFGGPAIPDGKVQASQDGTTWITLADLPGPGHSTAGFPMRTYSFASIAANLPSGSPFTPSSLQ